MAEGRILGMFRLALALPLRGLVQASLNMTRWKQFHQIEIRRSDGGNCRLHWLSKKEPRQTWPSLTGTQAKPDTIVICKGDSICRRLRQKTERRSSTRTGERASP